MEPEKRISTAFSQNSVEPISFFDKDSSFVFAYKKTEKLASATYMVTSLFSESEPMKWTLRKKVNELLSFMLGYKEVNQSNSSDFIVCVNTKILELVSLLEISQRGGLITSMNFSILKREFSILIDALGSAKILPKEASHNTLSKTFFDVDGSVLNIKDRYGVLSHRVDGIKDIPILKSRDEFKRSNRQNIILNLLKKKNELTIKDISEVIKDCSEKTIQRELISFISAGVIKRTGERRWSKYSLV